MTVTPNIFPTLARTRLPALDAVVVGGGPAGLSAALVLGRARKRVLVLDSGRPANAVAAGSIGGLLGQSGVAPFELRTAGREQLGEHPNVEFRDVAVVGARRLAAGFAVTLGDGSTIHTRALLLAHGLRYDPPALPGIDQLWGRSVFHCPFCDGWEVRERRLGLPADGAAAFPSALVIA